MSDKKDAERYRWIKSRLKLSLTSDGNQWTRQDGSVFISTHRLCDGDTQHAPGESLDEIIDMAMQIRQQAA